MLPLRGAGAGAAAAVDYDAIADAASFHGAPALSFGACSGRKKSFSHKVVLHISSVSGGAFCLGALMRQTLLAMLSAAKQSLPGPKKALGCADVDHIVAISSAKGGVGKSTTAGQLVIVIDLVIHQSLAWKPSSFYTSQPSYSLGNIT
jgi:hypothetical protein